MRHAILGAGGVGGFVGAVLAAAGERVLLLLRPETLVVHPNALTLDSPLGHLVAPCRLATTLEQDTDLLWVTTKATQLEAALDAIPDPSLAGTVVPLLNGVDHAARLRSRFGVERVVPGTIAAELERAEPGHIIHRSPFARFGFAAAGESRLKRAIEILTGFGCTVTLEPDELTLLWRKLVMLAPMALNTTAAERSVGELRQDPILWERFEETAREACAVALAEGARVSLDQTLGILRGLPASLRSSMQKDVAAGRPPELDAIGGPILRGARAHGIPVPVAASLVRTIEAFPPPLRGSAGPAPPPPSGPPSGAAP
ncbi:MAG TPA: 2-dehydropantoate 2-reductase [Gemmatimonadales bacterium]|nr:2-dehydropantoate 2-reductase [Gemmatimonadales bacterium]